MTERESDRERARREGERGELHATPNICNVKLALKRRYGNALLWPDAGNCHVCVFIA